MVMFPAINLLVWSLLYVLVGLDQEGSNHFAGKIDLVGLVLEILYS